MWRGSRELGERVSARDDRDGEDGLYSTWAGGGVAFLGLNGQFDQRHAIDERMQGVLFSLQGRRWISRIDRPRWAFACGSDRADL